MLGGSDTHPATLGLGDADEHQVKIPEWCSHHGEPQQQQDGRNRGGDRSGLPPCTRDVEGSFGTALPTQGAEEERTARDLLVTMLIGYARVSTVDQTLALQQDALAKAGCEKIFTDTASGAKAERPGLTEALAFARSGDTLVVWRLDRLGRSLRHLIDTVAVLDERGIHLRSLQEHLDTSTSGGKLVFHIFGALAEFERNLIRERSQAGLVAARARGRVGGRPRTEAFNTPQKVQMAKALHQDKRNSVTDICRTLRVSRTTFYPVHEGVAGRWSKAAPDEIRLTRSAAEK